MKFSFCTIAWRFQCIKLEDIIQILSLLGYNGIEIWESHLNGFETRLETLRKYLFHTNMEVSMISPYFDFTSSQKKWEESIIKGEKLIQFAKELHCPLIRVFTGKRGSAFAAKQRWSACVQGLSLVAEKAKEHNISLAIENHINTLADTIKSTTRLLNDINLPNVGLNLDLCNFYDVENKVDPIKVIDKFIHKLFHIHAKNSEAPLGLLTPFNYVLEKERIIQGIRNLRNGFLDYDSIFTHLIKNHYNKYVSIECFEKNRNIIRFAKDEIEYIKKVKESDDFTSLKIKKIPIMYANLEKII